MESIECSAIQGQVMIQTLHPTASRLGLARAYLPYLKVRRDLAFFIPHSEFPACRQALNLAWYRAGRHILHSTFVLPPYPFRFTPHD